jgi:predicted nucleotidyltransferase
MAVPTLQQVREEVAKFARRIAEEEEPFEIYLIGSFARGKAKPRDIDIIFRPLHSTEGSDFEAAFIEHADQWQRLLTEVLEFPVHVLFPIEKLIQSIPDDGILLYQAGSDQQ